MRLRLAPFSSAHAEPRPIDIWLPGAYAAEPERRFPVLYMHDGQNLFTPSLAVTGDAWDIDVALERLVAEGEARPAIVVAVWHTEARWREYMPQAALETPRGRAILERAREAPTEANAWLRDAPLADGYLRMVVEELKPAIDARYRTLPGPEDTVVMGSSMGGLISLYAVCRYPELFGGAGCLSTHWPAAEGAVVDWLEGALPAPGRHRFYFDHGSRGLDADYAPYQQRVDALLAHAGYRAGQDVLSLTFPGAEHNEAAWRARVARPLRFLFPPSP